METNNKLPIYTAVNAKYSISKYLVVSMPRDPMTPYFSHTVYFSLVCLRRVSVVCVISSYVVLLLYTVHSGQVCVSGSDLTERSAHPANVRLQVVGELWQLLQEVGTLFLNIEH